MSEAAAAQLWGHTKKSGICRKAEQARRFQMAVNVEGSGGWADRQRHLLLSGMVVLRQAVGVHEWWEPLLTPYAHYVHALRCTRWYRISMESGSSPEAISA